MMRPLDGTGPTWYQRGEFRVCIVCSTARTCDVCPYCTLKNEVRNLRKRITTLEATE